MSILQQLFNRESLTQQQAQFNEQVREFGRTRQDARAAVGDLSIVAPVTLSHVAALLEDAAIKATKLAEEQSNHALAEAQMQILREAISEMVVTLVEQGGDIKFDSGDPLYDPALLKILEKSVPKL